MKHIFTAEVAQNAENSFHLGNTSVVIRVHLRSSPLVFFASAFSATSAVSALAGREER